MDTMGERIRIIRNKLKLSQAEFANKLGLSGREATISDYENNKKIPEFTILRKIANVGETTTGWIEKGQDYTYDILQTMSKLKSLLAEKGKEDENSKSLYQELEHFKQLILNYNPICALYYEKLKEERELKICEAEPDIITEKILLSIKDLDEEAKRDILKHIQEKKLLTELFEERKKLKNAG